VSEALSEQCRSILECDEYRLDTMNTSQMSNSMSLPGNCWTRRLEDTQDDGDQETQNNGDQETQNNGDQETQNNGDQETQDDDHRMYWMIGKLFQVGFTGE